MLTAVAAESFTLHELEREGPRTSGGGGLTLARKLDSVWEGLLASGVAGCPVCDGRMERSAERASCRSCGSTLS